MRIIYDDAQQQEFAKELRCILECLKTELECVTRYDSGMDRIQWKLVKNYINNELKFNTNRQYQIADKNFDSSGIGNNHLFPVLYKASPEEFQQCAYISITQGLYSEVYITIKDYNEKSIGDGWEITKQGIYRLV